LRERRVGSLSLENLCGYQVHKVLKHCSLQGEKGRGKQGGRSREGREEGLGGGRKEEERGERVKREGEGEGGRS
jgi:hypothetical protein